MTDKLSQSDDESLTAPGKVLREQREKMGLSQAEVATRLHLSVQTIKDIEADDYTHFSAAIYVRGYIRSFASLVGVSSEPLLEAFVKMGFVDELNKEPRTSYIASSVTKTVRMHYSKRRIASWMSYGFFIFLIILVVLWWYGQRNHRHAMLSTNLLSAVTQVTQPKVVSTTPVAVTTTYEHPPLSTLPVSVTATRASPPPANTPATTGSTTEEHAALNQSSTAVMATHERPALNHASVATTAPHELRSSDNTPPISLPAPAPASVQNNALKDG